MDSNRIVRSISSLIQHGKLDEASRVLAESSLSPQSAEFQVLKCTILNAAGDDSSTLATLEKSRLVFPETWQFINLQLAVHMRQRDMSAAQDCMSSLLASKAPQPIKLYAQVRFVVSQENFEAAVTLLEDALATGKIAKSAEIARDLFNYHYRLENYSVCLDWLEQALAINSETEYDSGSLIVVLSDCDPQDQGEERLRALRERYPENTSILESMCSLQLMKGNTGELENLLAGAAGLNERGRRKLQRLASAAGLDYLPALQIADQEKVLEQYMQKVRQEVMPLRTVIEGFPLNQNWIHIKGEDAAGSVIAFNGGGGHFGVPISLFDHYFASLNLDVVYLRDNTRQFFFDGVEGLGKSIEAIIEKIADLELPRPVYCISNSGGSFGALNYGLHVPVDGMLLFAPFTYLASDFSKIRHYDPKFKIIADYIHRTYPDAIFDFKTAYENNPKTFPVHFYYGEKDLTCERHVRHMKGTPDVYAHPVPGAAHLVVRHLALHNELLTVLRSHLGSPVANAHSPNQTMGA